FGYSLVDWNGRYETPAGKARPRETPQAQIAPRRLPDRPRKASAWNGNQRSNRGQTRFSLSLDTELI
ncbi:hypothetical protein ACFUCS_23515, partial [Peribacillus frigoritolerans]